MTKLNENPSIKTAAAVVKSMTGKEVISVSRMPTGDQNFVFAVTTPDSEYIVRMTDEAHKQKFEAAIYWQKMLIPLGVPLAAFIQTDLEGKYSPFPSLLMNRLLGDDLINVYRDLTDADKKHLASEIVQIQSLVSVLPEGPGYGITDSYEHAHEFKTWYDFLMQRLAFYRDQVQNSGVFDFNKVSKVISVAKNMENNLKNIPATPFLWDASERNVLVYNGKITGIVDIDELCFGDPLLVIALTSTCLELERHDTVYTDYWAELLNLDRAELESAGLIYYVLPDKSNAVEFIGSHLSQETIVITAVRAIGEKSPILIDEMSLEKLPSHAVIIDLAAGEGGNVVGSQSDAIVRVKNDISIMNVSGYPKTVPHEASQAYAKCMFNLLEEIISPQGEILFDHELCKQSWITRDGQRNALF